MRFMSRALLACALACLVLLQPVQADTITHDGRDFEVDAALYERYPELYALILKTESMDDAERQHWFSIMPSMTTAQIDRLFDILETERRKLAELEKLYQDEINSLNQKHLLEWIALNLETAFKEDPARASSLFIPIWDENMIPPVALRRFGSMADIPRRSLGALLPGSGAQTPAPAIVTPGVFAQLFKTERTPNATRMAFVSYALELADRRDVYEAVFGTQIYADFIKLGAAQAARLSPMADLETLGARVPDIVDQRLRATPEKAVAQLTKDFDAGMAGKGPRPYSGILWALERLTGHLSADACVDLCQAMLDDGVLKLLSEQDALIAEIVANQGEAPTVSDFYRAIQIDYLSLFASDRQKSRAMQRLADKIATLARSHALANASPARVPWTEGDDAAALGAFILAGIDADGNWPASAMRQGWYSEVIGRYRRGAILPFANAVRAAHKAELDLGHAGNARRLEGALIEVQAFAILDMLISGTCTNKQRLLDDLQVSAGNLGKTPDSTAYSYREVNMVKSMSSFRVLRRFCTGVMEDGAPRTQDWHAVLIGLSDTTPGAPSHGLAPSDDYYLGGIPHNDVARMKAALLASPIRWQVTALTGADVTRQNVAQTVSRIFGEADGNDHVLIYFSGHGRIGRDGDAASYMRMLNNEEMDVASFVFHAARSHAMHSALIFDMCLAAPGPTARPAVKGTARRTDAYSADVTARNSGFKTSVNLIFATEEGMPALADRTSGASAFTALLAPVLGGQVAVGADRDITMQEALDHVRDKLRVNPRYRQAPHAEGVRGRLDWIVSGYRG